jgi:hypothetical protein
VNQSKCAIGLQRQATEGADLLKKPDLDRLLKHYYQVKVSATTNIVDLRVLLTSTVAAALVIGEVASDVGDAVPGVVGSAPAKEVKVLSSDNDDDDDDDQDKWRG